MNNSITDNSSVMNNLLTSNTLTSNTLTSNYIEIPLLTRQNGCSNLFKLLNNDEADKNISRQYSTDSNDSDYDKSDFDNFKASPLFILPQSIIDKNENYLYFNNSQNSDTVIKSPAESNKFTNDELNYMNEMQIDQYSAFLN